MFLDQIRGPDDLRALSHPQLETLSQEIRERIIQVVARNGGHLASNLGIVELTLAMHRVFQSPRDQFIFDVGHQCYVHKLVTGRVEQFPTLRTLGGLAGFPKVSESPHDVFDTGHSSTSLSAAVGLTIANEHFSRSGKVVVLLGDGAMGAGMIFEAMNHIGHRRSNLVVILNDNEMSISPNVGAMARYLHKIRLEPYYTTPKDYLAYVVKQIPGFGSRLYHVLSRIEGSLKYLLTPGILFEEFGFKYLGPIDGYDFTVLERTLTYAAHREGPVLVHVKTQKGRGYSPAQERLPVFHGVGPFEIETGEVKRSTAPTSYTAVFGETMVKMGHQNRNIVAITAAMKEGTGLVDFSARFPDRFFDVGIAEQHAVTCAAGMARGGLRPVVAIYSTFMQRAYDQILHDVALMNLPVMFCLDRGGLVGEDGPTHHGVFDLAFLRSIPRLTIMAPKDELEMARMMWFGATLNGPVALRFPRGPGVGARAKSPTTALQIGKAEICRDGSDVAIWALGSMLYPALEAAEELAQQGVEATVINPRFLKPLDTECLTDMLRRKMPLVTIEEGNLPGGFGSAVAEAAVDLGFSPRLLRIGLPDEFVCQGSPTELRALQGLDPSGIVKRVTAWLPGRPALRAARG